MWRVKQSWSLWRPSIVVVALAVAGWASAAGSALAEAEPAEASAEAWAAEATAIDGRVVVQWRIDGAMAAVGAHVYFQPEGGERFRLTRTPLAGAASVAAVPLPVAWTTTWWDDRERPPGAYWLSAIDATGERTWIGPLRPERASPPGRVYRPAPPRVTAAPLADATAARIKIEIADTGWTRVTRGALVAAGLDPDVDPRNLRLTRDGVEQAIVVRGEADGSFDPGDTVELYGVALDTPWDGTRAYWLSAGADAGRRVAIATGAAAGPVGATAFPSTVEQHETLYFSAGIKNGEAENWFGELVFDLPVDQAVALAAPDTAAGVDATLEVSLQGWTTGDHDVMVAVNGNEVGRVAFSGRRLGTGVVHVPHTLLVDGVNIVTLSNRTGNSESFVDRLRFTYQRRYRAHDDALGFTVPGGAAVRIGGFTESSVRLFDVTDPVSVREWTVDATEQDGTYSIALAEAAGARQLLAVSESAIHAPAAVRGRPLTDWTAASHQADILMLGPSGFFEALEPLRAWRESQGYTVAMIDVEDLYDELSAGDKTPRALRRFVAHALTSWADPKPRFLLLAGDATWDPRNYRGLGDHDLVPGKQVVTGASETISDDWLADLDHDGVPELAVGRLPVRNAAELTAVVGKILRYEATPIGQPWASEVLLSTDANAIGYNFEAAAAGVEASLPDELTTTRIEVGQAGTAAARVALLDHLARGKLLVAFHGHGSRTAWTRGGLLTLDDVDALGNGDRLPFVVAMNCANGLFHSIHSDSLAEGLLKAESGGAIAVWASSGFTINTTQARLSRELMQVLFTDQPPTLGEAVIAAKTAVVNPDIRRTWILFGDPATRLLPVFDQRLHGIFTDGFEAGAMTAWSTAAGQGGL